MISVGMKIGLVVGVVAEMEMEDRSSDMIFIPPLYYSCRGRVCDCPGMEKVLVG